MSKIESEILDLVTSTNQTILQLQTSSDELGTELENLRNDNIVFGSTMLALVKLLIDKEVITQEEFNVERLRKLARLDQDLAARESKNE